LIEADEPDDFTVYRITLRNSPNFHIVFRDAHGFTAWNLKIDTPSTARNTDGVDPASATDITVTHSFIRTGDDNVAIKGGEGGVGYMTVSDNHFFSGHGMSVGSETFGGVHDILVQALSLDGSDNGIRIKSNSSRASHLSGRMYARCEVASCVGHPLRQSGPQANRYPVYCDIRLEDVRVFGGGHISLQGLDPQHRLSVTLDGVVLDVPKLYKFSSAHAAVAYGPGPVNFLLQGEDVTSSGTPELRGTARRQAATQCLFLLKRMNSGQGF
jgi:polygalacturonase